MKVTNKFNLPQALVNIANLDSDTPHNAPDTFSATTLLKGVKEIVLELRHFNEITMDVSDMVWTIFGTAVHELAEKGNDGSDGESEIKFEWVLPVESKLGKTYKLTGRCDLYNENQMLLQDYKTATTWKFIYKDFEDWERQGYIYTLLIRKAGKYVKTVKFNALLKDWNQGELTRARYKGSYYPEHSIVSYIFEIEEQKLKEIENYIVDKVQQIVNIIENDISDNDIPECTPNERWATQTKYAIMKQGRQTAIKLCDTQEQANDWIKEQTKDKEKLYVETRPGENKKCGQYCIAKDFCSYYKANKGE